MMNTAPDFSTAIIVILFLSILGISAYFIKKKSVPLKKMIKKEDNLEVINQLSLRNGYIAYVFKVGRENFFFVGHKSGHCSLTQVSSSVTPNQVEETSHQKNHSKPLTSTNLKDEKINEKKPLEHVNISDLLTAHKKGKKDA